MSVRLGLSHGTQTIWFASDPWFVPERGLRVEYGDEELRFVVTLAAKGAPTALATAVRSLRSLVRAIDRGGGSLLINDSVDVVSYSIRDAQLQELPERLDLWPSGYARVTLVLRCDAESVSSTARTLLEQFVTETGQPVVVDPEGPAVLGLRVAPHDEPLPPAIEAYVMDGEYNISDLVIQLDRGTLHGGIYTFTGQYTAISSDVDIYAEVIDEPAGPALAITRVTPLPPYTRLVALTAPPATLTGSWQTGDIFVVRSNKLEAGWQHISGILQARQLASSATTVNLPPSMLVVGLRGPTLLRVIRDYARQTVTTFPDSRSISVSLTVNLPVLPSGQAYLLLGKATAGYIMYAQDTNNNTLKIVSYDYQEQAAVSGATPTGYVLRYENEYLAEWVGTSSTLTVSYLASLGNMPENFAWASAWVEYEFIVMAIPSSAMSTLIPGMYRITVASYRGTTPVALVHYEQFAQVASGYSLRVEFDSRDPGVTQKVFLQRVGTSQWYSTSASPPAVTLMAQGTAESLPNVTSAGIRRTVSVALTPAGVQYPRQVRSAAYVSGGRRLVPVGRFSLHPGRSYTVTVEKEEPSLLRLWALPRPRVAVAGAYTLRSLLLESIRDEGRQVVQVTEGAAAAANITVTHSYSTPWLMLRLASFSSPPQAVLATDWQGSGFIRGSTTASPLRIQYPDIGVPLVAVNLSSTKQPIAYYHEGDYSTTPLASGRTVSAVVFLHNPQTSSVSATISLEGAGSGGSTSLNVSLTGGEYTTRTISLTLSASTTHVVIALTGTSGARVYTNVLWTSQGFPSLLGRQLFYRDQWYWVQPAYPQAGTRLFGWNVYQIYVFPSSVGSCASPPPAIALQVTASEPNGTYSQTTNPAYFVVAGQVYAFTSSLDGVIPSGYTVTRQLIYPGGTVDIAGTASGTYTFVPNSDGWCQLKLTIVKNTTTSSINVCAYFRDLSLGTSVGTLRTLTNLPTGASSLSIAWHRSSAQWAVALRAVWRHDTVNGKFGEIPLVSGNPLEFWFGSSTIEVRRGGSTLVSVTRPSTVPRTLLLSYNGTTLTLRVGTPGSWTSSSANVSLPNVNGMVTLSGDNMGGEFGIRWLVLVNEPSPAFATGTLSALGSDEQAYAAVLGQSSYAYWYADEPYLVYRPGNVVLGAQRGVLEVHGKATLVVFPIESLEEREIVDRQFVVDVLSYTKW